MMNRISLLAVAGLVLAGGAVAWAARAPKPDVIKEPTRAPAQASVLDFKVKDIDGKDAELSKYKGKVVLIVNVASRCGNTPQYTALEALYKKYHAQGFEVVGFPANNFGGQEPGTDEQIKEFCTSKYDVTFPMMSKISVKGDDKHPLYAFLTEGKAGDEFKGDVEWNFTKFLVDRNGNVIARFFNRTKPDAPQVVAAVEKALAAKAGGGEKVSVAK
jgi:glutathione peroxidase